MARYMVIGGINPQRPHSQKHSVPMHARACLRMLPSTFRQHLNFHEVEQKVKVDRAYIALFIARAVWHHGEIFYHGSS